MENVSINKRAKRIPKAFKSQDCIFHNIQIQITPISGHENKLMNNSQSILLKHYRSLFKTFIKAFLFIN